MGCSSSSEGAPLPRRAVGGLQGYSGLNRTPTNINQKQVAAASTPSSRGTDNESTHAASPFSNSNGNKHLEVNGGEAAVVVASFTEKRGSTPKSVDREERTPSPVIKVPTPPPPVLPQEAADSRTNSLQSLNKNKEAEENNSRKSSPSPCPSIHPVDGCVSLFAELAEQQQSQQSSNNSSRSTSRRSSKSASSSSHHTANNCSNSMESLQAPDVALATTTAALADNRVESKTSTRHSGSARSGNSERPGSRATSKTSSSTSSKKTDSRNSSANHSYHSTRSTSNKSPGSSASSVRSFQGESSQPDAAALIAQQVAAEQVDQLMSFLDEETRESPERSHSQSSTIRSVHSCDDSRQGTPDVGKQAASAESGSLEYRALEENSKDKCHEEQNESNVFFEDGLQQSDRKSREEDDVVNVDENTSRNGTTLEEEEMIKPTNGKTEAKQVDDSTYEDQSENHSLVQGKIIESDIEFKENPRRQQVLKESKDTLETEDDGGQIYIIDDNSKKIA